jgi:hypothetical protein
MDITLKGSATAALVMLITHEVAYLTTYETITVVVAEKSTIFKTDDPNPLDGYTPINWQVHTVSETFRVSPDWRRCEFDAAERYHALSPGQTYRVKVAGWSLPFINWHRNIVHVEN